MDAENSRDHEEKLESIPSDAPRSATPMNAAAASTNVEPHTASAEDSMMDPATVDTDSSSSSMETSSDVETSSEEKKSEAEHMISNREVEDSTGTEMHSQMVAVDDARVALEEESAMPDSCGTTSTEETSSLLPQAPVEVHETEEQAAAAVEEEDEEKSQRTFPFSSFVKEEEEVQPVSPAPPPPPLPPRSSSPAVATEDPNPSSSPHLTSSLVVPAALPARSETIPERSPSLHPPLSYGVGNEHQRSKDAVRSSRARRERSDGRGGGAGGREGVRGDPGWCAAFASGTSASLSPPGLRAQLAKSYADRIAMLEDEIEELRVRRERIHTLLPETLKKETLPPPLNEEAEAEAETALGKGTSRAEVEATMQGHGAEEWIVSKGHAWARRRRNGPAGASFSRRAERPASGIRCPSFYQGTPFAVPPGPRPSSAQPTASPSPSTKKRTEHPTTTTAVGGAGGTEPALGALPRCHTAPRGEAGLSRALTLQRSPSAGEKKKKKKNAAQEREEWLKDVDSSCLMGSFLRCDAYRSYTFRRADRFIPLVRCGSELFYDCTTSTASRNAAGDRPEVGAGGEQPRKRGNLAVGKFSTPGPGSYTPRFGLLPHRKTSRTRF